MMKVVGFDLDDTLVAEVQFIRSGIFHIARTLSRAFPVLPEHRIISRMEAAVMTRTNHYSAIEALIAEYGLSQVIDMKEVVARFRSHLPDPSIYRVVPSMLGILESLRKDRTIKTVLISDGRSLTQRNKIASAGLSAYFDPSDIYISEETGHDKTDPDTFLHVMEKYAGASEFHYIGDNPAKDFLHPSKLGWHIHRIHPFPLMIHPYADTSSGRKSSGSTS